MDKVIRKISFHKKQILAAFHRAGCCNDASELNVLVCFCFETNPIVGEDTNGGVKFGGNIFNPSGIKNPPGGVN